MTMKRTPNYLGAPVGKNHQHCQTLVGWDGHVAILVEEKPDVAAMNPVDPTDAKPPAPADLVPTAKSNSGLTANMLNKI